MDRRSFLELLAAAVAQPAAALEPASSAAQRGAYPRLSRDGATLAAEREPFDVVIVGSGYGGAIAASRLARARTVDGRPVRVCVLERGKEYLPGGFPVDIAGLLPELQAATSDAHYGDNGALLDLHLGEGASAVVGSALGGTSQINANVALRADPRVLGQSGWPAPFRADPAMLEPYYRRAEKMLEPRPYPQAYQTLAKYRALKTFGDHIPGQGLAFPELSTLTRPAPITVRDHSGPNAAGVEQYKCVGCGNCITGCNYGAKNAVTMNYLPDAVAHGARIYTGVTVLQIVQDAGGYRVDYVLTGERRWGKAGQDKPAQQTASVRATLVVLAAGTLGSTEILLRSREVANLAVSDALGTRFSCNGDMIGFGVDHEIPVEAMGLTAQDAATQVGPGPCITGVVDLRNAGLFDPLVIQEASVPAPLSRIFAEVIATGSALQSFSLDGLARGLLCARPGKNADEPLTATPARLAHTQTYLAMGHDGQAGQLALRKDRVHIRWPDAAQAPVFEAQHRLLGGSVDALGGTYVPSPAWRPLPAGPAIDPTVGELAKGHVLTVHPLGGCPMADDAEHGVVDHFGRVFAGLHGTDVHAGLYVSDGSIMPTSLGVNPFLTIAALAERASELIASSRGWSIDDAPSSLTPPPARPSPPRSSAGPVHIRFSEALAGDYVPRDSSAGPSSGAVLDLEINVVDVDKMLADVLHRAAVTGHVTLPALGLDREPIHWGEFRLFEQDDCDRSGNLRDVVTDLASVKLNRRVMRYRILLRPQGQSIFMDGRKIIRNDAGQDLWFDASTLHTTWHAGDSTDGTRLGSSTLVVDLDRFRFPAVVEAPDRSTGVAALASFSLFFSRTLLLTHAPDIQKRPAYPVAAAGASGLTKPPGPLTVHGVTKIPQRHEIAVDDRRLQLHHYVVPGGSPVVMFCGFGTGSQCFATDTIDKNLVQFMCEAGYDVWLADYRTSTMLADCGKPTDLDEIARRDYPALIGKVRDLTGTAQVSIVGHCMGAECFCIATLGGFVPKSWIRTVVLSQVGPIVRGSKGNRFKADIGLQLVEAYGNRPYKDFDIGAAAVTCYTDDHVKPLGEILDRLLLTYPLPDAEQCASPTCRRATAIFGLLYQHGQLADATHCSLNDMLGRANLRTFGQLARIFLRERMVSATGEDIYLDHLDRMAFPILFLHGERNAVFHPDTTLRSRELLAAANREIDYQRILFRDYGHLDCIFGRDAPREVFPHIAGFFATH